MNNAYLRRGLGLFVFALCFALFSLFPVYYENLGSLKGEPLGTVANCRNQNTYAQGRNNAGQRRKPLAGQRGGYVFCQLSNG